MTRCVDSFTSSDVCMFFSGCELTEIISHIVDVDYNGATACVNQVMDESKNLACRS